MALRFFMGQRVLPFVLVVAMMAALTGCKEEAQKGAPPAPLVEVKTITAGDVPVTSEYVAQTAGSREVEVRARVTGILLKRTYTEGRPIKKGALMFEIDPDTYKAALDQAEGQLAQEQARLSRARLERDRVLALYADNAVSQKDRDDAVTEFDSASAAVKVAQARVKEARINLGYTRVDAPIAGVTSKEVRSEGSLVSPSADGSLLTTITRLDPLYVNFGVPGTEMSSLRRLIESGKAEMPADGLAVQLTLPDGTVYARTGKITFTDKQVDQTTGTVRSRAEFPNPEAEVMPGQFVRAKVLGLVLKNAIIVPQRAVLETQKGPMVYVVGSDMVANLRPVVVAEALGGDYLIEKGLSGGETIIVEGIIKARPGQPVRVAQPANGAAPAAAQPGAAS
ncbi:efflux RND transporter periplasmic adaptor subunit [Nitratidesulfovibrio vulgaris]|uniref:Efflux transporter, RND family, MFP subunit n=2 Tax=Nitratidesulfovibrio vulgaris TaxID=881 RepID=Q72G03_NITV2|nr:efflux RND transporter periplasmic adaptor subunit [Nitratidesulfovibrio vulgaris]GEB81374.1 hemolysin D [Desulfovibrio desulfuricans]HBW14856.1 efflux RND transporter periplasmic adaptor subunit [Desulfovibrio sp.]AAS94544.1 efflux transporter, RND family, MFP subunit [Nitratidesulfovibrio vulgaris str. Hildenborough]ABM29912.1 efflux transporter, RND family, MFP subunit [Nitratidesulfovibrio vulgaris DP4]ADP85259.1 efflux transporter, RND family, MFP subunit [Nitratidesulfovibrio vulgaris